MIDAVDVFAELNSAFAGEPTVLCGARRQGRRRPDRHHPRGARRRHRGVSPPGDRRRRRQRGHRRRALHLRPDGAGARRARARAARRPGGAGALPRRQRARITRCGRSASQQRGRRARLDDAAGHRRARRRLRPGAHRRTAGRAGRQRPPDRRCTSPTADQMHDFRTIQDHARPDTTSDLLFKGAVAGHGPQRLHRADPRSATRRQGTNAFQTNRNLKLSDERLGRERAQPRDRDQRRALQPRLARSARSTRSSASTSRAAACRPSVAERLIVLGFFDEVLDQLPGARRWCRGLRRQVAAKLDRRDGLMRHGGRRAVRSTSCAPGTAPQVRGRRPRRSPSCASATTSTPSATRCSHANVSLQRGRGAGATSARSSAGSTAARSRSSTGEPQTLPATQPVPVYDVRVDGDDVRESTVGPCRRVDA